MAKDDFWNKDMSNVWDNVKCHNALHTFPCTALSVCTMGNILQLRKGYIGPPDLNFIYLSTIGFQG